MPDSAPTPDSAGRPTDTPPPRKSVVGVVIHSFFIIPFLIAVFSVVMFALIQLMVRDRETVYDYLNEIKVGGATKRWQAAYELSKILSHPTQAPTEPRFANEMISLFRQSEHDDPRVRLYLIRAMGATGNPAFSDTLLAALREERASETPEILHSLGLLREPRAMPAVQAYLSSEDPLVRNRAVIAMGFIGDPAAVERLKPLLHDAEPNVAWNAAIALARLGDPAGRDLLRQLLDRNHWKQYPQVDRYEQDQALLVIIDVAAGLDDPELKTAIRRLSESDPNVKVRHAALAALK
jgi:HEAT repeat protein